ncbi:MAG: lipoyl(octanoyl) transferase LipB [Gammaproteobacteria bacterium]|nr:MAG: lipoyl(octanoyl) transferase LipB [Gammaproteobacteria bacterium]
MISFVCRDLGLQPLPAVWADMKRFTDERDAETPDEVWFVEHPSIFTLGLNGDRSHLLMPGQIPILQIDRGGQVTYHGPGQLVVYPLLDLKRLKISVRGLVQALEAAVIDTVASYGIEAYGRRDAPGVYVGGRKLAAIGLRIRRHCSYHGIAINVDMDLEPFQRINPCGFENLEVTRLSELSTVQELSKLRRDLEPQLHLRLDHLSAVA